MASHGYSAARCMEVVLFLAVFASPLSAQRMPPSIEQIRMGRGGHQRVSPLPIAMQQRGYNLGLTRTSCIIFSTSPGIALARQLPSQQCHLWRGHGVHAIIVIQLMVGEGGRQNIENRLHRAPPYECCLGRGVDSLS